MGQEQGVHGETERYRVIGDAFGRGSGAVVHRLHDRVRDQEVAQKRLVLGSDEHENSEAIALFEREYYMLAQFRHPHIVTVYDYGIDDGAPYYTMELLPGRDLYQLAPMDSTRACEILRDVASALSMLHARRLVHRDVSARNVGTTHEGRAKLIDFGTMVPMGLAEDAAGTPPFMSPEALRGEALDGRSDLFALGALGYFLLRGRHAFAAKHLGDLREVWRTQPQAPHTIDSHIPRALGELVMSMLQMERSRRPKDANEVVARLTVLAGLPEEDHQAVQTAHLAVPKLVGRERTLMSVRKRALRVVRGRGAALLMEGEAGLGRSRMLDACALEGQIVGALPLRAEATHGRSGDYTLIRALLRELVQLSPEHTCEAARPFASVIGRLSPELHERLGGGELTKFASRYEERPAMQRALRAFFIELSERKPIFISIDNVHRGDEPSVSVLALLTRAVVDHRIVITVSAPPDGGDDALPALQLLREGCEVIRLTPLRDSETRALVESMLGVAPRVTTLADQLHRVSGGNPGVCLTMLQHLMSRGVLRHTDDGWMIPERIDDEDLPRTVADACQAQLRALSADALALARAIASSEGQAGLQDYLALLDHDDPRRLYAALSELLTHDILVGSGRGYGFRHVGVAAAVRASIDDTQRRVHSHRLAKVLRANGGDPVVVAHHLLQAGKIEAATECLVSHVKELESQPLFLEPAALPHIENAFEGVLAACKNRPELANDALLLEIALVGFSMFIDPALAARYASSIETALARATGLVHWEQTDAQLDPLARIGECLTRAEKAWSAQAEHERAYHPFRALELLGRYVLYSLAPTTTMLDAQGIDRLRSLIEPFIPVAPVLAVIHEVACASHDIALALDKKGEQAFLKVLARIEQADAGGLPPFIHTHFRLAMLYALCLSRAFCTDPRSDAWILELDSDPLQQPNAWRMRRHQHLIRGDLSQAQRCAERLEALMLENSGVRTLEGGTAYADLRMAVLSTDLGELKRAVSNISALAKRFPRYVPLEACAVGVYETACGDTEAARLSLERGLEAMSPDTHVAWGTAIDDYLALRHELDGAELVAPLIEQAIARAAAVPLDLRMTSNLEALLALCEAELSEHSRALTRIRGVLAACHEYGLAPLQMSTVYLRGARVALFAGDNALFEETARCYAMVCKSSGLPGLLSRYDSLIQLAHGGGAKPSAALDGLVADSTQKLGGRRVRSELRRQLAMSVDATERVNRTLRWLCVRSHALEGHLYAVKLDAMTHVQSTTGQPPSSVIEQLVRARLDAALCEMDAVTERQSKQSAELVVPSDVSVILIEQRVHGAPSITAIVALERRGDYSAEVSTDVLRAVEMELDPEDLLTLAGDLLAVREA